MRLGIDFGTTRTRVAAALKGNYPLVSFRTDRGAVSDWYASLIAAQGSRLLFGSRAEAVQHKAEWEMLRSFKRLLSDSAPDALWMVGSVELPAMEWVTLFLRTLRNDLVRRSNLDLSRRERLEVMVGVPANANSNQRFLTLEAFRDAGFHVLGMMNEPSAAGIEYAHRYRRDGLTRRREHVVVYDLGGGTFDVSVIRMAGKEHEVLSSEGISRLGGDDFDELLLQLALLDAAPAPRDPSRPGSRLLDLCREAKERISPNSRKITVDLGQADPSLSDVVIPVARFYEKCFPLILQSIEATEAAMESVFGNADGEGLAAIYLVGGSCELPIMARSLRERFGKRVRSSPYPSGATAIGLAIAADEEGGYDLEDRFGRHFGVWREGESGEKVVFDLIFTKRTPLPRPGEPPLTAQRRYHPVHNVGRFRFLECSALKEPNQPAGDIVSWKVIVFPFDPELVNAPQLEKIAVKRTAAGQSYLIEERYECDSAGVIQVTMANLTTGHTKTCRIR
jgi:molecular chaperone DnaK (HSP70)